MLTTEDQHWNEYIDKLTHYEMCRLWRFAEPGHPVFNSSLPYYQRFMDKYNKFGGMTPEISKQLG